MGSHAFHQSGNFWIGFAIRVLIAAGVASLPSVLHFFHRRRNARLDG